jgi:Spy/CpxP family protein refolding chaperone
MALTALGPVQAAQTATAPLTLPVTQPGSLPVLLGSDRVQKELNLSAKQKTQIQSLRSGYRDASRKIVASVDPNDSAAKRSAQKSIEATNVSYNQRVLAILTPEQKTRLTQIQRQLLGGHLLLSAEVREQLNLTDKQKVKLAKIHQKHQKRVAKVNGWYEAGEVGNYERLLYLRQDRLAQAEAMEEVLNRDQRTAFNAMMGVPFVP